MMNLIFSNVLEMSMSAGFVILIVALIRMGLKYVSKVITYALWALVLFRLLCPFSFSSGISLIPDFNRIKSSIEEIEFSIEVQNKAQSEESAEGKHFHIPDIASPSNGESAEKILYTADTGDTEKNSAYITKSAGLIDIFGYIWIAGLLVTDALIAGKYIKLKRKLLYSTLDEDNIYKSDRINIPFLLGVFKPRIYLPLSVDSSSSKNIITHMRSHIARGDHIVRLIYLLALTIHWFNPLVWVGFLLMNRDMEMSCDEYTINEAKDNIREEYSQNLLDISKEQEEFKTMSLIFGEKGIKSRAKSIIKYKRPAFWLTAVVSLLVIALSFTLIGNTGISAVDNSLSQIKVIEEKENTTSGNEPESSQIIEQEHSSNDDFEIIEEPQITGENLSVYKKAIKIDGWEYFEFDYGTRLYRSRENSSSRELLFSVMEGLMRGGGIINLTQCSHYLLFTHAAYIYKMDLNTLETEILVEADNPSACFKFAVTGDNVYFVGTQEDYTDGIYVININGTNPERITDKVSGLFWQIQIYNDELYVSIQGTGLYKVSIDGRSVDKVKWVPSNSAGSFIISNEMIYWLKDPMVLQQIDLNTGSVKTVSDKCTGFIVKEGELVYSQTKSGSSGIYIFNSRDDSEKMVYEGIASVVGGYENVLFIDKGSAHIEKYHIEQIKEKPPEKESDIIEGIAKVATKDEFTESSLDDAVKIIRVVADITLNDNGYYLYASNNKKKLIIDEGATLIISSYNFMLQGCDLENNGTLIVAGRIVTYDPIAFSGNGQIECRSYGSIECYIQTETPFNTIKKLMAEDSPYTKVTVRVWAESSFVISTDLVIPAGKALDISKSNGQYFLEVSSGATLTNNGTIYLSEEPRINGSYNGIGTVYMNGDIINLR